MKLPFVKRLAGMAAAVAAAAVVVSCSREPAATRDEEVVVAEVNGARITLKDLKNEIASLRGLAAAETRRATSGEVSRAMRLLVERTVVLREGDRLGVAVAGAEVDAEVRRFRADFPPGGLEKALTRAGIGMEEWREGLRRSILYRKAAAAIAAARAEVGEEEVRQVYLQRRREMSRPERIRVRQLLFDSEEAARNARALVVDGKEPEEAARRQAADDAVPTEADLGFLTRDELPPDLSEALFALPEGGVSEIVRREKSYSLFLVLRKESARTLELADAAPEIREELLRAKREEAYRTWLAGEVGRADVRIQESILAGLSEERK